MTTTINHVTSAAKTGKSLSLDEYKNLTGDRQLQQMIQSAVTSAIGQMYLDNPISDHSNTEKLTMPTIDAKMKRCCISTEFGNIWVQGKTIPQMCQAFHEKMRMLEGASSDSQEEGSNPLFEDYAQEWWDTYEAKRLSGGTKIDYDMNLHKHVIPYFKGKRLKTSRPKMCRDSMMNERSMPIRPVVTGGRCCTASLIPPLRIICWRRILPRAFV